MQERIKEFLAQRNFALAGSFRNENKVAYQIYEFLKSKGCEVYPVNPRVKEVVGMRCYKSVLDIPVVCDVADLVTPPEVSEKIVRECKEKGITRVWFQPGAQSDEAISFCQENGIAVVYGCCLMK